MTFATGSVAITNLPDGEPTTLTVTLDRPMLDATYDVSLLRSPALMGHGITASVLERTTTTVTVQVTAEFGFAGQAVLHALAYVEPAKTTGKPEDKPPVVTPPVVVPPVVVPPVTPEPKPKPK